MRRITFILLLCVALIPVCAFAKRGPRPKVNPVDYHGIRYTPFGDGRRQSVRASDIQTGKKLWEITVFRNFIVPLAEEDVQWVFIKKMFIDQGKLIVVAEDGDAFAVDLKKRSVKKLDQVPIEKPQTETNSVTKG